MDCNYNFNPDNCAYGLGRCNYTTHEDELGNPSCFCNTARMDGVRIIHAYNHHWEKGNLIFMQQLFRGISNVS